MAVSELRGVRFTDLLTPANAFQGGASAPTLEVIRDTAFYGTFLRHDQTDVFGVVIQFPHERRPGRSLGDVHMHYMPAVAPAAPPENVYLRVRYAWVPVGGTIPAIVGWTSSNPTIPIVAADVYKHLTFDLLTNVAAPASDTYSSIMLLEIARLGTDGSDTYSTDKTDPGTNAANFCVLAVDSHYPVEQDGSKDEWTD